MTFSIKEWWGLPHRDILSGLVVAFAMIPEAIAFSGIAGVDPSVGLFGAFLLAVTLAVVGGRTAMITSATGSTALLMTGLVQRGDALGEGLGLQYLLAAGLLTGLFQIAWGYLRLAHQMRFVPQPVMAGFVNALAILILLAQLPQLGLDVFHPEKVVVQAAQLPAVWSLMLLTLAIIYLLPRLTRAVPSALIAILITTGISISLGLELPTVASLGSLPTGLPRFALPQVPLSLGTLGLILPTALAISLVGLMETFLTQDILDDLTDQTSHKNTEARGQGIGNIVSSLFGGMAGCALVGQSVMNVGYGGRTRLSTLTSGVSLLAMILLARDWVNQIPMATLVGVMVMIAINTANIASITGIRQIPKSDTAVMLLTVAVTVVTHNLAIGLLSGVALAGILFSRKVAKVIAVESHLIDAGHRLYTVRGQLFFVSSVYFRAGFEIHEHPARVTIDMADAHIWDQSGVTALDQVIRRLKLGGSAVEVVHLNRESTDLFARIGQAEEAGGGGGGLGPAH
ncbi:SulP family inorganic anion transporter [Synechococcus sp. BA-132 BA5]|uniref:SulP family inorganic anion transporter n=1 Tax=Synechococcus sp. BA-132 BA5 TaxID=3110252 RepID=UPI002B21282C|nr:SulP family inorganic anion transporter [Synechococcus sp. BA-132 BA5]MEA5415772.1 SulP family inorganic anion transporter [Synechococcus sp. BA-132 BA5]